MTQQRLKKKWFQFTPTPLIPNMTESMKRRKFQFIPTVLTPWLFYIEVYISEAIGKREKKRSQFNLILLMPLVLIALIACTTSQSAAETKRSIPNPSKDRILTSKLYSECRTAITEEHFEKSFCNSYIDGAFEGMATGIFFTLQSVNGIEDQIQVNLRNRSTINICWPHGKRPPNIKIAQQFIGWAKSHSRELFYPESAISGLVQSQRIAFPCAVKNQQ